MQGRAGNVLTSTDKLHSLKQKTWNMENPRNQWEFRDVSSRRPDKMPRNFTSHFGSSDFHTGENRSLFSYIVN